MKLKYIVAALGLVASAASQASIVNNSATGDAEMLLVVWDANASYTLDLGITYSQFLASNGSSATWATLGSSNWTSFLTGADTSTWQYAVIDSKTNFGGNNAATLSTIGADYTGQIIGTYNNSDIQFAVAQTNNYAVAVGATGTHTSVANGDSVNAKGTSGYFLTAAMDTFNGLYGNSSAVGTNSAFELIQRTQLTAGDPIETIQAGVVSFNQVGGNYVLSYNVAAVPEPSGYALALAGFGVFGFIARRRRDYK